MYFVQVPLEIRADNNAEMTRGTIEGYASVFNVVDSYDTKFVRGCFQKSLKSRMPAFLLHHDSRLPAGITLEISEDNNGLKYKAEMNLEVQSVREAYALAKQGALKGLSIGFVPVKYEEDESEDIRTFTEVELFEVSMVTFPANDSALIKAVRNNELPKDIRSFEKFLRDAGYSRNDSKRIASYGFKSNQDLCDAENEAVLRKLNTFLTQLTGKQNDNRTTN